MKIRVLTAQLLGLAGLVLFLSGFVIDVAGSGFWSARRLEVHEWGVSKYDWASGTKPASELPDFFYTSKSPGTPFGTSTNRVKDMEADSGIRVWTKPILYFYGPDTLQGRPHKEPIPVGVEVRFKDGEALAWWPEVSEFRTFEQAAKAPAPDLEGWNRRRMERYRATLKDRLTPEQFQKAWSYNEGRKFMPNSLGFSPSDFGGMAPFPDDPRFQLVWDRLSLFGILPQSGKRSGEELPNSHWVQIARQVDSEYVSNGRETEKFLFYEGKTPEFPAIALVSYLNPRGRGPTFLVYNVSHHPIYDLFLVYRDKTKSRFWAQYQREAQPYQKRRDPVGPRSAPHLIYPTVPDFQHMAQEQFINETEFDRRTELRLGRALVTEFPPASDGDYVEQRNPAQFQPPTTESKLFPKEVAALEQIWNQEFFERDGLTIIYREATDYLDEAVPLHVFTDMKHYVSLARCSLVVNRNINPNQIAATEKQLNAALSKIEKDGKLDRATQQELRTGLRKDRFGFMGFLAFCRASGGREPAVAQLEQIVGLPSQRPPSREPSNRLDP